MKKPTISVIIPAYNEGKYVADLIKEVLKVENVKEVLLVDDCSKPEFANFYDTIKGIKVLHKKVNEGKDLALRDGIRATSGEYLMFLDADLQGITAHHLNEVQKYIPQYDLIRMLRGDDIPIAKFIGITYLIGGEHLIKREVLERFSKDLFGSVRWGFESELNKVILSSPDVKTLFCELEGVNHIMKAQKEGFLKGWLSDIKMAWNVVFVKHKFFSFFTRMWGLKKYSRSRAYIGHE